MFIKSVKTFRVSLQYVLHTALGAIDSSHVKWSAVMMISTNKLTREISQITWFYYKANTQNKIAGLMKGHCHAKNHVIFTIE